MATLMLASLLQVLSAHPTLSHLSIKQLNRIEITRTSIAQGQEGSVFLVETY